MNTEYIIELKQIRYSYPDGTLALDDLNLRFPKNKKIAILGANGAGKSTLFCVLNGIHHAQSGSYQYGGQAVEYNKNALRQLRSNVGIVFQEPDHQIFAPTVFEEISFGPMNLKIDKTEVKKRVDWAIEQTHLQALRSKAPHLLSFGQKKMVCIASILSMQPEVMVLDEPTAGLDHQHAIQTMQLLEKLHREGKTIILSTHDVSMAYSWADWVVVLRKGSCVLEGTPQDVFMDTRFDAIEELEKPLLLKVYEKLKQIYPALPCPKKEEDLLAYLTSENEIHPSRHQ